MFHFCRFKFKLKYRIKEELIVLTVIWLLLKVTLAASACLTSCSDELNQFFHLPQLYLSIVLHFLLFSFLTTFPLLTNYRNQEETNNILTLIYEFPEALYFWSPNYYFDVFLATHFPEHVNYRPLMADILRFNY